MTIASRLIALILLAAAASLPTLTRGPETNPGAILAPSNQLARSPVAKMIGYWKGIGWSMSPDGQRVEFTARERARWNMAGTSIMVEGLGTSPDGAIIGHNAMGVIEMEGEAIAFHARRVGGAWQKKTLTIDPATSVMTWSVAENVRMTITIDDTTWIEKGEVSTDGGQTWREFFGMRLDRVESEAALAAQATP